MDTAYDPIKKHRKLIEHLMLGHMSSFPVNTPLVSMLGYSEILLKEVAGPLNDDQKQFLSSINNNTYRLHKYLNTFITASRLIFKPQQIYVSKFSISEAVARFTERIQKDTEFQINKDIPEDLQDVEGDASLFDYAIENIDGLIRQIHPDGKGDINIIIREKKESMNIIISTNKDRTINLEEENVELFIAQTVAEIHSGSFKINYDESMCNITFTIPMKQE